MGIEYYRYIFLIFGIFSTSLLFDYLDKKFIHFSRKVRAPHCVELTDQKCDQFIVKLNSKYVIVNIIYIKIVTLSTSYFLYMYVYVIVIVELKYKLIKFKNVTQETAEGRVLT